MVDMMWDIPGSSSADFYRASAQHVMHSVTVMPIRSSVCLSIRHMLCRNRLTLYTPKEIIVLHQIIRSCYTYRW